MDKINSLINSFSKIDDPKDYFVGKSTLNFPPPNNVLSFFRQSFEVETKRYYVHSHHRYILIYNLGKPFDVIVDGTLLSVEEMEGILILPFQNHNFILNREDVNTSVIFISFTMEKNQYFEVLRNNKFIIEDNSLTLLMEFQKSYVDQNSDEIPFLVGLLLIDILKGKNLIQTNNKVSDSPILSQIISEIHDNIGTSILEMAKKLGYNENYLRRYFKKNVGISLGNYILEIKTNKAMALLNSDEMNITEIAHECGYDSISSFSRSFKTYVNISPNQFRKMVKNNPEMFAIYRNKVKFQDNE